jgi:uncharacterized protein YerC
MPAASTSLYRAIRTCRTEAEVKDFIADLLSEPEIERAEQRWSIAQTRIRTSCSIRAARKLHGASQELVQRVFAAVEHEESGYRRTYGRLFGKPNKSGS